MPHNFTNQMLLYINGIRDDFSIGKCYESGYIVEKDIDTAMLFFRRAQQQGNGEASFKLGQVNEIKEDAGEASNQSSESYEAGRGDTIESLEKVKSGKTASDTIESNASEETRSLKAAIKYYVFAIRKNHDGAKKRLEFLAQSGRAEAQYAWGYDYYHYNKNMLEAAKWCMKAAEQKHVQAVKYLEETTFGIDICLKIADMYERGDGIVHNMAQAVIFYTKASNLGYQNNAFRLGQLYQVDHGEVKRNPDEACKHLILAAKQGQLAALIMLERLGEEVSAGMQVELGNMFRSPPFNDTDRATHWYQFAIEAGNAEAAKLLAQVNKPSGQNKTSTFFKPAANTTDKNRVLLCGATGDAGMTLKTGQSRLPSRFVLLSERV